MTEKFKTMSRGGRAGLLVLALLVMVFCLGLVGDRNLTKNNRTRVQYIRPVQTSTAWSATALSPETGTRGVLMQVDTDPTGPTSFSAPVWTSSIAPPPYPARLDIRMVEAGSAESLVCTSAVVKGYNSLGYYVTETVTSITEAENLTANSYEKVTYIKATGCTTTDADGNKFSVRVSDHVGLRQRVSVNTDILSICTASEPNTGIAGTTRCLDGSRYTINRGANSVDLKVAQAVTGPISGDAVTIAHNALTWITIQGYGQ